MTIVSPITIALIEDRPATAVSALAKIDPSDAAAFVVSLPTHHAVSIFTNLNALSSSEIISEMEPVSGAAILSDLDYQTTLSIVRVLKREYRLQLLNSLPKQLKQTLVAALTFPADTVGAKMSTNIIIMTEQQTSAEGLAELRKKKRSKTGLVYVVEANKRLMGVVSAESLLRRSSRSRLGDVIDRSVKPVSARARLSTIKSLSVWDDYSQIPVVDRRQVLIGALPRGVFREPIEPPSPDDARSRSPSVFGAVAGSFASSSVGLAGLLIGMVVTSDGSEESPSSSKRGDRT